MEWLQQRRVAAARLRPNPRIRIDDRDFFAFPDLPRGLSVLLDKFIGTIEADEPGVVDLVVFLRLQTDGIYRRWGDQNHAGVREEVVRRRVAESVNNGGEVVRVGIERDVKLARGARKAGIVASEPDDNQAQPRTILLLLTSGKDLMSGIMMSVVNRPDVNMSVPDCRLRRQLRCCNRRNLQTRDQQGCCRCKRQSIHLDS
jgi:hypothetical protein